MRFFNFLKQLFRTPGVRISIKQEDKQIVKEKWQEVEELMKLGRPSNFRQAIIEADKLLNYVLEKMGHEGSLGEKIKAGKNRFSKAVYNDIWQAHKMRNQLVHDISPEILDFQAKKAVGQFERGLRILGVL